MFINKMKKYPTVENSGENSQNQRKIDTPSKHINDCSLSWFLHRQMQHWVENDMHSEGVTH